MKLVNDFDDYKILAANDKEKLEMWGKYKFLRPDPQIIWNIKSNDNEKYLNCDAHYHRNSKGGGYWEYRKNVPESFTINYKHLKFKIGLMGFKHTGLFPEQSVNWDYFMKKLEKENREVKVLNLFAYTGGATIACMSKNAHVTHVDSSKGMVEWAKENVKLSNLDETKVRFIVDDVIKFVKREIKRGNKYDAIIMDPPSFGRGASGEVWDIEKDLFTLLDLCTNIISNDPLFIHINSYTTGLGITTIENLLKVTINKSKTGRIVSDEIGIKIENSDLILPCGLFSRWELDD